MKTKRRQARHWLAPVTRATSVIAAVTILAGGVTYAALQSQQIKITGNSIATATANLQISQDGNNYSDAQTGFVFSNIVPGGQAMPLNGYSFFLKNGGGTPLQLKFLVPSTLTNNNNIDLSKVTVVLSALSGGAPQTFTLAALVAAAQTGGIPITSPSQLMPGASVGYSLRVSMASDAVTGPGATLDNFDFAFTGLAQSN